MSSPYFFSRRSLHLILSTLLSLASCLPALAGGGSGPGLTPAGNYVVPSVTQLSEGFGSAMAVGDFDGDGTADLAVGSPYAKGIMNGNNGGRVDVFRGDGVALRYVNSYVGNAQSYAGWSLAAGDFDGDGSDELAIGVPYETVGSAYGAGKVVVLSWNPSTKTMTIAGSFNQGMAQINETAEYNDNFGKALASGDFDGDDIDDLAIGVPGETLAANAVAAGLVHVLYGALNTGLLSRAQQWTQNVYGVVGTSNNNDAFGFALAAGDFNGDFVDDLAVGVPGEAAETAYHTGGVETFYGSSGSGLSPTGNQLLLVGPFGLVGNPQVVAWFGSALSACDFNHDGKVDLAIGAPHADPFSQSEAGMVWEVYGGPYGLTATGAQIWTAADLGHLGHPGEHFGYALACGSFDGGSYADLAIGSPLVDLGVIADIGVVDVVYGTSQGLSSIATQRFDSSTLASGPTFANQFFGAALAAGDFDDNGRADLAVGIPGLVLGVQILRGDSDVLFFDRFETGNKLLWSAEFP